MSGKSGTRKELRKLEIEAENKRLEADKEKQRLEAESKRKDLEAVEAEKRRAHELEMKRLELSSHAWHTSRT